ncbi:MAG: TlpA family protein disulfide reductase [Candidatus Dormibacteraeota bacterium]|nr:TlpA family protein disulfide reductase [Candidatus Dormibacteraeota bacterium]
MALIAFSVVVRPSAQLLPPGTPAPALTLVSTTGQTVNALQAAAHHNLVITFFDTQCDTCRAQAPQLCAVSLQRSGDVVIAVDAGGESTDTLEAYAQSNFSSSCRVTVLADPDRTVSRAYRAAVVPTVYVVASGGEIAYAAVGSDGVNGLSATLRRLGG